MEIKKLMVAGSYSVGLFFKGKALPKPGETVIGNRFFEGPGGKGSNQAIAARVLGADVEFVCKIGKDSYGDAAVEMYKKYDMHGHGIITDSNQQTSVGVILIDETGTNAIMIVPAANLALSVDEITTAIDRNPGAFLIGFQLESDIQTVVQAIKASHNRGLKTLLDPAPAARLPEDVFPYITYLKPNEHEAAVLSGIQINTVDDAYKAGRWFVDKGVQAAIITLGSKGTVLVEEERERYFTCPKAEAIDTTGAGDVFSGAFMTALAEGYTLDDAIVFANCAASISVERMGVVEAIPARTEVEESYKLIKAGGN